MTEWLNHVLNFFNLLSSLVPKSNHPKFVGERDVCWPVSTLAQKAVASPRVHELSTPKERKALYEGYNPYVISRAARSACASARVRQLSLPLLRKCSSQWRACTSASPGSSEISVQKLRSSNVMLWYLLFLNIKCAPLMISYSFVSIFSYWGDFWWFFCNQCPSSLANKPPYWYCMGSSYY